MIKTEEDPHLESLHPALQLLDTECLTCNQNLPQTEEQRINIKEGTNKQTRSVFKFGDDFLFSYIFLQAEKHF